MIERLELANNGPEKDLCPRPKGRLVRSRLNPARRGLGCFPFTAAEGKGSSLSVMGTKLK
jgi:hypothetical protein